MVRYKRHKSQRDLDGGNKAQLNIEFTGGAILFFVTLVFLLSTVLSNIPKHTGQAETNRLSLTAESLTGKLIDHTGAWNSSGTNHRWEDHTDQLTSLGLADSYHTLAQDKIDAMRNDLNRIEVQSALGLRRARIRYNLSLIRLVPVKTTKTFGKGNGSKYGLTEPSDDKCDYSEMEPLIHYGARGISGDDYHLLIGRHAVDGDYYYWISVNEKDFTDESETGDDVCYEIQAKLEEDVYVGSSGDYFIGKRSGAQASNGNLIVFQRKLLSHGFQPSPTAGNIVQTRRYTTLGNDSVKLVLQVWRQ